MLAGYSTIVRQVCNYSTYYVGEETPTALEFTRFLCGFFSSQGLKELPVRGILMIAQTTSVRMEESVWMESILTTAAVLLSGQVRSKRDVKQS